MVSVFLFTEAMSQLPNISIMAVAGHFMSINLIVKCDVI